MCLLTTVKDKIGNTVGAVVECAEFPCQGKKKGKDLAALHQPKSF